MTCFVSHTTIDCHNAYDLCQWWKQLLGYVDLEGDPNLPGHVECMILDPDTGHRLLFIEVPDQDLPAKRVHFDVRPRTGTREQEVERLLGQGVTQVADHRGIHGPGSGWVTFADPEGNEFCVVRSIAELEA